MLTFLFDIDDTLYDQVLPFKKAYEEVCKDKYNINVESLFVQSRKHSDEVFMLSQTGKMSTEDMYVYRIQKAFEDFDVEISRDDALKLQELYGKKQYEIEMSHEITELFDYCYGKVQLGIISNGPSVHQWNKAKQLNLQRWIPKEYIFVSADLGVSKPDKKIFDYAVKHMSSIPETTYYVGDSFNNDIVGAENAGLKTIWMNRRSHLLPENAVPPHYIVSSEKELSETIKKIISS